MWDLKFRETIRWTAYVVKYIIFKYIPKKPLFLSSTRIESQHNQHIEILGPVTPWMPEVHIGDEPDEVPTSIPPEVPTSTAQEVFQRPLSTSQVPTSRPQEISQRSLSTSQVPNSRPQEVFQRSLSTSPRLIEVAQRSPSTSQQMPCTSQQIPLTSNTSQMHYGKIYF